MTVIAILNPKGGSGKTTLATNLAAHYLRQQRRVLLIDADQQASAREWHAARDDEGLPLVALDTEASLRNVRQVAGSYEMAIIDGAAKLEKLLGPAIAQADAILIPVTPSPYDIWAVADLVELIKARQEVTNGRPRAAFVISRAIKNTRLSREVVEAALEHGLPIFAAGTTQRQGYAATAADGHSVVDGGHPDAAAEIEAIAAELDHLAQE